MRHETGQSRFSHDRAFLRTSGRRDTKMHAIVHCRGRFQSVGIRDISPGGMKLESAFGLLPRDIITIELLSRRTIGATVAWAVAPDTGIAFDQPLSEDDPLLVGQ
jgi:PilZ domain